MTETENLQALVQNPDNRIVVRCAKNAIAIDSDDLGIGDFVESTFGGYAPVVNPGWGPIEEDSSDYAEVVSDACHFEADGSTSAEEITAMFVTLSVSGGSEVLLSAFPMAESVWMGEEGDVFERQIRLSSVVS